MRTMLSPLVERELRLRMRERKAFWLPALYLGLSTFVFVQGYAQQEWRRLPAELGVELFAMLGVTYFLAVLLVCPALAAACVTSEKEQRTLVPLVLTALRPHEIIFGKILASSAYVLILVSLAVPFHVLAFALGGVAWEQLGRFYVSLILFCVGLAALGVRLSVFFRRSAYATATYYALVGLTFALMPAVSLAERWIPDEYLLAIRETIWALNPFCVSNATEGYAAPWLWLMVLALVCGLGHGAATQLERRAARD